MNKRAVAAKPATRAINFPVQLRSAVFNLRARPSRVVSSTPLLCFLGRGCVAYTTSGTTKGGR